VIQHAHRPSTITATKADVAWRVGVSEHGDEEKLWDDRAVAVLDSGVRKHTKLETSPSRKARRVVDSPK
jgi:hypothetical protein